MHRPAPTWLFDLDNTLHNASTHIFPHIHRSMTAYLARHLGVTEEQADALRIGYWRRYGATLAGLMRHHNTDPGHFLSETHRFDKLHELMVFDRGLAATLRQLPGRKIVFSNGPTQYVEAILGTMGIRRLIDDVFAVEHMRFEPKPSVHAFRRLLRSHRLRATDCVLVEDSVENLRTARRLGMKTVLIGRGHGRPAHTDLKISSVLDLRRHRLRLFS